jgi:hypothetical protein
MIASADIHLGLSSACWGPEQTLAKPNFPTLNKAIQSLIRQYIYPTSTSVISCSMPPTMYI